MSATRLDSPGGRLRFARIRRGVTQTDLAWMVGVTQPQVSHWERGQTMPRPDMQDVIADALATPRLFLFGDATELRTFRHLVLVHWDEVQALAAAIHRGTIGQDDLLAAVDGQRDSLAAVVDLAVA